VLNAQFQIKDQELLHLMKGVCSACNFAEFKQKIKSIGQKESEN
jgi:hypothetical protein